MLLAAAVLEDTNLFCCCRLAAPWRSLSSGPRRCPSSSSRDRHPQACDSLSFSAVLLVQKKRAAFDGSPLVFGEGGA